MKSRCRSPFSRRVDSMSISNATRELVQAIFDNDPHRVSTRSRRGSSMPAAAYRGN